MLFDTRVGSYLPAAPARYIQAALHRDGDPRVIFAGETHTHPLHHLMQYELVRAAIELGLERGNQERELVSRLLSELHEDWLPASDVSRGFEALLARVDDLALDNPRAVEHLAAFMTRAVADEVLPPAWVTSAPPEKLTTPAQLAVISSARAPLCPTHGRSVRRARRKSRASENHRKEKA